MTREEIGVSKALLGATVPIYSVDGCGVIRKLEARDTDADNPSISKFPYGATVLPTTDGHGNMVVVFSQPSCAGRTDVLVVEHPSTLSTGVGGHQWECQTNEKSGTTRIRIPMAIQTANPNIGGAILRIATALGRAVALDRVSLEVLKGIRYSFRIADESGWYEHGAANITSSAFEHGHPDIATREQGGAGIRGPSLLFVGEPRIRDADCRPLRDGGSAAAGRAIYEVHIGTFTEQGNLSSAAVHLGYLANLGFTTIQLMPVDITSGPPGWSYDQTRTGAVDTNQYGGASELVDFVRTAHCHGLEVIVDKQYNHEGPEQDSRAQIISGMFCRQTKWGGGLSGSESDCYPQVVKLIGEEFAFWTMNYGIDGLRLDATNRLPWEIHQRIGNFAAQLSQLADKPIYVLSEYAECEPPIGLRVPTGHQYTDQTGRYLMRILDLSEADHVRNLSSDRGSLLRAMLKAALRGWWYPDVTDPVGGIRGSERIASLLWHHDWIGNRFGGERISSLIDFNLFKSIVTWQLLGQWTPLIFMGTERYCKTPWYFFTGHRDKETQNNTSATYCLQDGEPVLCGGRYSEFASEAFAAGLKSPLAFSADKTTAGIDWAAFRQQLDLQGRPYMDHSKPDTFIASKLKWAAEDPKQLEIEELFRKLLQARSDPRLREEDPSHVQYKAWVEHERFFLLRRRDETHKEFVAFFNLGGDDMSVRISSEGINLATLNEGYLINLIEDKPEDEWDTTGSYSIWLDTSSVLPPDPTLDGGRFWVSKHSESHIVVVKGPGALIFSKS